MTRIEKIVLIAIIAVTIFLELIGNAFAEIGPALTEEIAAADDSEFVKIIIDFNNPATLLKNSPMALDKSLKPAARYSRMNTFLRKQAESNSTAIDSVVQSLINKNLMRNFEVFWIAGMARAEARKDGVIVLNNHTAVKSVELDFPISVMEPVITKETSSFLTGIETGLNVIGAREAWEAGYNGSGRIVCNIDTGVDGTHPALMLKYRGNNGSPDEQCWFDPYTHTTYPEDGRTHGTHTMGTMVGSDGADTIGVAPGAQWIAAAAVDRGGNLNRTLSDIIASFQWAADPDGDPSTVEDRPDVINNSWGVPRGLRPECDDTFWEVIDNCEELGVVCVFAAGNEGPDPQTLRTPADRTASPANSFCIGAIDGNDNNYPVAQFSSRGPSGCDGLIIKPQVVAPGVLIRSSTPGGGYVLGSGTSMASPHVAGAVAILRQAKPDATVDEIKYALMNSAADLGTEGPDFDYGYGLINIPAAIDILLDPATSTEDGNTEFANQPVSPVLHGNYPNPFNASTTIKFSLIDNSRVNLSVYNIAGEKVAVLIDGHLNSGNHDITWDGVDDNGASVSSGVYFMSLSADDERVTKRMTLLK